MKKLFNLALIAGVAVGSLAGCAKESVKTNDGVFVKLLSPAGETRGVGSHVGAVAATMNDGAVYFTNSNGGILHAVTLLGGADAGDAYDPDTKEVGMTTATNAGFTVNGLPGAVAKVYVVGNLHKTYPTSGNISQLKTDQSIHVSSQYDATDKGVKQVTLVGSQNLTGAGETKSATVTVKPIAARIEIGRITGTGRIKSFTLGGVYINNFHREMGIEGMVVSEAIFNGPADKAAYGEATNTTYLSEGILADWSDVNFVALTGPAVGYAPVASATADNVWAYNLFAPQASADGAQIPHVIIKIIDTVVVDDKGTVTTSDDTDDATSFAGEKWLTIRNYYKSGSVAPLALLEQGNVYRIGDAGQTNDGDLTFDEDDLTDDPEQSTINATVKATIMTWIPNEVGYDFN